MAGTAASITITHSENEERRRASSGPSFEAFLPSVLPPYNPFLGKAYKPITFEQAESFLLTNQRSLNWKSRVVLRHGTSTFVRAGDQMV